MKTFNVYKSEDINNGIIVHTFAEIMVALRMLEGPMSFKKVQNVETKEKWSAFDILNFNESYQDAKNIIKAIETIFD
jgi:hypothetical protein